MEVNLKCYNCGHGWTGDYTSHFPTGDCPVTCPECGEYNLCPKCGGKLDEPSEDEDVRAYCGDGCGGCGWDHCGGCV